MDKDSRGRVGHQRRQRHSHTLSTNNACQQRGGGSRGTKGRRGVEEEDGPGGFRCRRTTGRHGLKNN